MVAGLPYLWVCFLLIILPLPIPPFTELLLVESFVFKEVILLVLLPA
jgi:hypothetical protein